jgi:hypothetical protein
MKSANPTANQTGHVDEFMEKLGHPFKAEVQMVREIIKNVDAEIAEQIKWNAPSFWEMKRIHLVFHNPMISKVKSKLLEGDYDHRRMAYFDDQADILAKKAALEKALKDLIRLQKQVEERV